MMDRFLKITALAVGLSSSTVMGQDYERFAPKPVPKDSSEVEIVSNIPEAMGSDEVLVDALSGVVLVQSGDAVKRDGQSVQGLSMQGFDLLVGSDFPAVVEPYFGKPVTLLMLNQLSRDIIVFYRQMNFPLVDVIVPEQDITTGTVQLVVTESLLGTVRAEGNRWVASRTLEGQVRINSGERIDARRLLKDINWLNQNPFRSVDVVFTEGEELGTTDILLRTEDRFPIRIYAGYEDTGNDLTGEERFIFGANWGNAFFLDHQLNYQYTASTNFEDVAAHSVSYVAPLPWRHTLTAFASFVDTQADAVPFTLAGSSAQAGIRYTVPLPDIKTYAHEVYAGFDWKQSDNTLEFGFVPVSANTEDIGQFLFGYRASLPDRFGVSALDLQVVHSPGGIFGHQNDSDFRSVRATADDDYTYLRLNVSRLTRLPWDFTLSTELNWQITNTSLLASEQLGFGGFSSIRGYDERELINTDEGFFIRNELRLPAFSVLQLFGQTVGEKWADDQLQFLAFWDYGMAEAASGQVTRIDGSTADRVYMSGIGPGLRYTVNQWLSVRADYAFQLIDTRNGRYASRWHLGIIVSY
ncbi:MAG: ShlB/FhaC/HecB family hemolysin secretion/activation protein [Verrucomicrobiota bacterium]